MIQVAIFVCLGWILSVCLHEFGHAIVAYWGGDTTVKEKGYLTLNPIKYTDINLSLVLPLIFLLLGGIPLPGAAVYIDHRRLRGRAWKSAVSAAGPLASILVALLLAIGFKLTFPTSLDPEEIGNFQLNLASPIYNFSWIWPAVAFLAYLEVFVVIINLLPIPSLDGYGIIEPWLPAEIQNKLRKFAKYGIFVLFALLWFVEPFNSLLASLAFGITQILGIPVELVGLGYSLFNKWATNLLVGTLLVAIVVRKLTQKPEDAAYERGMAKIRAKKFEEAIADFDRAIRLKSDSIEAWYMRGHALLQLQRYDDAIAAYDRAIEIKSDYGQAWYERGLTLENLQRYEEAIESYQKTGEIHPDFYSVWERSGIVYNQLQRYEEAIQAFDRALEIQSRNASIWTDKGVACGYLERYEEAIECCDRAINIDPRYFYAWYNKAGCYAEQGNLELAISSLKQAAKIDLAKLKQIIEKDPSFDLIRNNYYLKELIGK